MGIRNRILRRFKSLDESSLRDIRELQEKEWLEKPHVHGVGIGDGGLILFVEKGTDKREFDSYTYSKLKIMEVKPFNALLLRTDRHRPIKGGISIGHKDITAGTFSMLVQDKTTKEKLILSNNHVLANVNKGQKGDAIYQPGRADGGISTSIVGHLERFESIRNGVDIDAAVATLTKPEIATTGLVDIGEVTELGTVFVGQKVLKSGRTTGITYGKVLSSSANIKVGYDSANIIINDCIVFDARSSGGDSGSVILEQNTNKLVGILFAGNGVQTIGSKIQNVFTKLNLELIPVVEPIVLDLSHHNGRIVNVSNMKLAGTIATFLKITQGDYYKDDLFDGNWEICKNNKIPVAPYIFVDPAISAEKHFEWFKQCLANKIPDIPIMIDCEYVNGQSQAKITSVIQKLCALIEEFSRSTLNLSAPFIYTRASWWNINVLPWSGWKRYPLMIARWGTYAAWYGIKDPYKPRDWDEWELWQYSADGNLQGSRFGVESKSVDKSHPFAGFIEKYLSGVTPPPPPPPPTYPLAQVIVDGLRKRTKPSIIGVIVGYLKYGEKVEVIEEIKQTNGDVWIQIGTNVYCAMKYQGKQYVQYI
jgi:GH25 family lysozyme M1 (1,4-beta-N-acetylmuramidase)